MALGCIFILFVLINVSNPCWRHEIKLISFPLKENTQTKNLQFIFKNLVNIRHGMCGRKKLMPLQFWNIKKRRAKANGLVSARLLSLPYLHQQSKDSREIKKKYNPEPGHRERDRQLVQFCVVRAYQMLVGTVLGEGAIWRLVTGLYHSWKNNW